MFSCAKRLVAADLRLKWLTGPTRTLTRTAKREESDADDATKTSKSLGFRCGDLFDLDWLYGKASRLWLLSKC